MFTRCPSCRTVFYITAAELRAAEGAVVCGACDTTFDALESLSETRPLDALSPESASKAPPAAWLDVPPEPEPPAPEPATDERARDEEEFLEEVESLLGGDDSPDEALEGLEFTAGPMRAPQFPPAAAKGNEFADWDMLPEELSEDELRDDAVPEHVFAEDESDLVDDVHVAGDFDDDELLEGIPDPDSVFLVDEEDEPARAPDDAAASPVVAMAEPEGELEELGRADGGAEDRERDLDQDEDRVLIAARSGTEESAAETPDGVPEFIWEERPKRRWLRVVLPLIAILGLGGTWIHTQHAQLLRQPVGEAVLGPIYRALGVTVAPDWNPADFRVLRSEAVADTGEAGRLRVTVEFMNGAAFAQPHPVIRVALQDRFGRRVGAQDFAPGDYVRNHQSGSRMAAGARLQASVVIPDPDSRADGFRVSLCLELDRRGLVCGDEQLR